MIKRAAYGGADDMENYDVIIIGAGPAGFCAGIYSVRYNLKTLLIGKELGGQISEAWEVDNYPGLPGIKGMDMAKKFKEHAEKLGVGIKLFTEVSGVEKKGDGFLVKTGSDERFTGNAVIFATGSRKRKMGIPGEKKLAGKGVSYCATCDAAFFRDKTVAVIGGGNSAVRAAILLAEQSKKVYLIYRRTFDKMKAVPYWKEKARENPKIEMIFESAPTEILGEDRVESINIKGKEKQYKMEVDGVFIEIGSEPASSLAKELGAEVEGNGMVKTGRDMSTTIPGIFAAGDITGESNRFEQIVTAAAEGAIAAESAYNYVKDSGGKGSS